jgi:hypothetical protein
MSLSLSLWFDIAAPMVAVLGFGAMFLLLKKRKLRGRDGKKFVIAAGALVIGIAIGAWYWKLLIAPEHVTPSLGIEILELVLYCLAFFFIFAFLAYAFWVGGPLVLQAFQKLLAGNP